MHEDCPVFISYTEFDVPREYASNDFLKTGFAWRIPWTEEPGGLQSMGWQRVRHD